MSQDILAIVVLNAC